jgi:hypothetical protein
MKNALAGKFVTLIDTLASDLVASCDVVLPERRLPRRPAPSRTGRASCRPFEQAIL